ncbi:hypothetical protein MPTK1_3g05890 [Marchantia polymorpha subsp. ruderalis]|uniref:Uncharacterized protein n=2 Tax=Marchantia polymorpha TaxID=3197 RepID=A0AAF6AXV0_MARPO|nr:hypothetical protein MARPO_0006s0060 [Marchantia polymorpha]BBN04584.1 hypothetical protein Mp_3g05890 [Marchantia polymorpha subsp. ruderalis]|eukprot:PTQ48021.1 hypothetical protein MARPO_0006s0060 [Marchantia polymorpha]
MLLGEEERRGKCHMPNVHGHVSRAICRGGKKRMGASEMEMEMVREGEGGGPPTPNPRGLLLMPWVGMSNVDDDYNDGIACSNVLREDILISLQDTARGAPRAQRRAEQARPDRARWRTRSGQRSFLSRSEESNGDGGPGSDDRMTMNE